MNKAILMGRLTKDVELKVTPQGTNVCRFTIAVNRRFQKDTTDFINCTSWRKTAEFICKYFSKGNMIAVVGSIQTNVWEKDGQKQYSTEVLVDEAYFTASKNDSVQADNVQNSSPDIDEPFNAFIPSDEDVPF